MQSNKLKYRYYMDGYILHFQTKSNETFNLRFLTKIRLQICPLNSTWIEKSWPWTLNFQYPVFAFSIEIGHRNHLLVFYFYIIQYLYIYLCSLNALGIKYWTKKPLLILMNIRDNGPFSPSQKIKGNKKLTDRPGPGRARFW